MESVPLSQLCQLSGTHKTVLERGKFSTVSELLLTPPGEVAKKCRIGRSDIAAIIEKVSHESARRVRLLDQALIDDEEAFTTGDPSLDDSLGGGIRTGMIWEFAGESAAGKTQLALQLSLSVQLPQNQGGLSGSACYLTTSSPLATSRILQIAERHPLFSPVLCNLTRIHTISTPTVSILMLVLSRTLPSFLRMQSKQSNPVKLLIIDTLTQLFYSSPESIKDKLVDRSRIIAEISGHLHSLARWYQIAVVVLNETSDVFDRRIDVAACDDNDMTYWQQAQWFNRAHSLSGEGRKEIRLGLPWANQVNSRLLFSRTDREQFLGVFLRGPSSRPIQLGSESTSSTPRNDDENSHSSLVRRLNVVFSSVGHAKSSDYIVTAVGLVVIPRRPS